MSILGFYKKGEGPEELVAEIKEGEGGELYVELPSGIRNRMEIVVGNKIKCIIAGLVDKYDNFLSKVNEEKTWEVVGYWNELHISQEEITRYRFKNGDRVKLLLKSVIQWGEEFII